MKKLLFFLLITLSFGQTPIKNRAIYTDTVRAWLNSGTTFPGAVNFTGLTNAAYKANLHLGANNKLYISTDTSGSGSNPTKLVLIDSLNNTGITATIDLTGNAITSGAVTASGLSVLDSLRIVGSARIGTSLQYPERLTLENGLFVNAMTIKNSRHTTIASVDSSGRGTFVGLTTSGSVIGASSQDVFNTVSTTVNAFGAATALTLGATTGTTTVRNATTFNKANTYFGISGAAGILSLWDETSVAYVDFSIDDGFFNLAGSSISNATWTGTAIGTTYGGTGLTSFTQGDLIYSSASNTLAQLAKNTSATRYLSNTGSSNNPAWAQVDVSNGITGIADTSNLAAIRTVTAKTMLTALRYNTYDIQISADTLTRSLSFATDNDRIADSTLAAAKVGGSGTANTLAMFTAASTLGNSAITQSSGGNAVTTSSDSVIITAGFLDADSLLDDGTTIRTSEAWHSGIGASSLGNLSIGTLTSYGTSFIVRGVAGGYVTSTIGGSGVAGDAKLRLYTNTSPNYYYQDINTTSSGLAGNTSFSIPTTDGTALIGASSKGYLGKTGTTNYVVGDLPYANTTTSVTMLGAGSDGHVLTLASGIPSWAAAAGGAMTKAQIVDSLNNTGITSSIDFSSNIVTMAASIVDSTKTSVAGDQYMKEWQYRITTVDTTRDPVIDSIAHELTFALDAASLYEFEYQLYFTNSDASNATGVEVLATCASAPTTISGIFSGPLNAGVGTGLLSHDIQNSNADTVRTLSVFTNLTPMPHVYIGRILTNAATALNFSFQPEETSGTVLATLKRGSYGKIRKLYP